ncbi:DUF6653 family protein [Natronorubrum halophilum]|uniref:DUF6653 family protein n=1 Tax=Natronorubrum halophilum TaxID=1702106 RepID=UPI0010C23F97|nr:DUF6653 family protein [Natronorubrum halophilum]
MISQPDPEAGLANRLFWSRHANPGSVWTFVGAYLLLVASIYRRSRPLLVGTLLFVAVNPLLFSPPKTDDAWATRVVLGERVWLERGLVSSSHTRFTLACAPVYLFTLRSAANRRPLRTGVGTVASLALMLLFFDRMARLYEDERSV